MSYGDLTTRNMADVDHLEFSKFEFMSSGLYRHAILLPCEIGKSVAELWQKTTMFKMAVIRHLEF